MAAEEERPAGLMYVAWSLGSSPGRQSRQTRPRLVQFLQGLRSPHLILRALQRLQACRTLVRF